MHIDDYELVIPHEDIPEEIEEQLFKDYEDSICFDPCCRETHFVNYKISTDSDSLKNMPGRMAKMLLFLLTFLPNTESKKSKRNALFAYDNALSSNFVFLKLIGLAGMAERDCLICNEIDKGLVTNYKGKICINCQKIIMTINKDKNFVNKETETEALFRHLRNIIAHGNYEIIGEYIVGFDCNRNKNKCTAVIKIKPYNIIKAVTNDLYFKNIEKAFNI